MSEGELLSASDSWLRDFVELIGRRFGHHVPDRRLGAVRRAIIDAYVASGESSLAQYRERLSDMPLDAPCIAELTSRITVKESYFFRDEFTTATLREVVLPKLVAPARKRRELTIWSAGCSCGEEPYTVAIILDELLGGSPGFAVRIVGTDVDAAGLRTARAAVYGEWSVRTLPEGLRQKYFEAVGGKFALRDRYKKWVSFELHNLAESGARVPEPGTFDLVLCRNVGIYLSEVALETLYAALGQAVRPGGLVVTAPSDPRPSSAAGLNAVLLRGPEHVTVAYAPHGSPWDFGTEERRSEPNDAETSPTIPAPPPSLPPPLPQVPTLVLSTPPAPLKAAPYLERALLEIERNEHLAAERTLAKVLYLAPDLVEAHYRLGLLQARRGNITSARRSFFNALGAAVTREGEAPAWASRIGVELARMEKR